MSAYYNEKDPFAAAWLRALIAEGHIAPGEVDDRSIEDVTPHDVRGFTQCHFFAGIGVWSYALRRAGWADTTRVWTGSCPCQPFSNAGKGEGADDHRHLWPTWFRLIRESDVDVVFGEQVASNDGLAWLDVVSTDLEGAGYAVGAADLCAAGFGAPHIRQRLYFVADADRDGAQQPPRVVSGDEGQHEVRAARRDHTSVTGGAARELADAASCGRGTGLRDQRASGVRRAESLDDRRAVELAHANGDGRDQGRKRQPPARRDGLIRDSAAGVVGHAGGAGLQGREPQDVCGARRREEGRAAREPSGARLAGFWSDAEWLYCRDGKWRPVEPRTFPLAHGAPGRVGRLRGYGNAIVAEVAAGFIEAFCDVTGRTRTPRVDEIEAVIASQGAR